MAGESSMKDTPAELRAANWLTMFTKVCPRCGTVLALDAKGCSTCLQQFKRRRRIKDAKRLGTRSIKSKQN